MRLSHSLCTADRISYRKMKFLLHIPCFFGSYVVFRYHHAKISKSMSLLSAMMCSLLCTALHPHTHSSPLRCSSPAPYGAKTAYVGGVPVSQARYGVTGKLIMPAYKSLPVTSYQLCIVTSFQHSTDFLRSPSSERQLVTAFVTFLADA